MLLIVSSGEMKQIVGTQDTNLLVEWHQPIRRLGPMPPHPLLEALHQRPFVPFRLYVSDGPVYLIKHPDLVLVAPGYIIVGVPPEVPQPSVMIERHVVVDLGHITRLEPVEPAGTGSK